MDVIQGILGRKVIIYIVSFFDIDCLSVVCYFLIKVNLMQTVLIFGLNLLLRCVQILLKP